MRDLLVRSVPDEVVHFFQAEAQRHQRSMQEELLDTLKARAAESLRRERAIAEARSIRKAQGKELTSDSAELLRADRAR